jgi:hypothetical protein
VPGFSGDLVATIKTQADVAADGAFGSLLTRLKNQLARSVNQNIPAAKTMDKATATFGRFVEKELYQQTVRQVSVSFNLARAEIERVQLADPIVSATRTSVLDEGTCEVCERLDGMTMNAKASEFREYTPPNKCLGGHKCNCLWLYNQASMRPSLREENFAPLPQSLEEKVWY